MINIKHASEIDKMRRVGIIVAKAHSAVAQAIRPGITTKDLDDVALSVIKAEGAIPSFKNYNGFPANTCISVNNEVIHGIPSSKRLAEGDIASVDIGALLDGFHGDAAATYGVGKISSQAQLLIDIAKKSFFEGIKNAREGLRISDISLAVQRVVESAGFSVVKDYVGHGVGKNLHEEPEVPNFYSGRRGARLYAGMTIAVEPMINSGGAEVKVLRDRWTVVTVDNSLSAHYEHTIAITKNEPLILTYPEF